MFSQESFEVNREVAQGAQLRMFGGSAPALQSSDGVSSKRAPSRSRSSKSSERSSDKQWRTRVGGSAELSEHSEHRTTSRMRESDPHAANRINKVMLTGRLGRNARPRETNGGQSVADFFVGTDEFFKDTLGEWQQKTAWHRVEVWGEAAEMVGPQLREGSRVYVEGRLVIRRWIDRKNKRQTSKEIVASDVRFLSEGPRTATDDKGRLAAEPVGDRE